MFSLSCWADSSMKTCPQSKADSGFWRVKNCSFYSHWSFQRQFWQGIQVVTLRLLLWRSHTTEDLKDLLLGNKRDIALAMGIQPQRGAVTSPEEGEQMGRIHLWSSLVSSGEENAKLLPRYTEESTPDTFLNSCWRTASQDGLDSLCQSWTSPPALWEEQLLGQLSLRVALAILGGSTLWVLSLVYVFIGWERTAGSHDFRRN